MVCTLTLASNSRKKFPGGWISCNQSRRAKPWVRASRLCPMISSVIDEGAPAANMSVQWWTRSVIASYTTPHVLPLLPCFGVASNALALIGEQQNFPKNWEANKERGMCSSYDPHDRSAMLHILFSLCLLSIIQSWYLELILQRPTLLGSSWICQLLLELGILKEWSVCNYNRFFKAEKKNP